VGFGVKVLITIFVALAIFLPMQTMASGYEQTLLNQLLGPPLGSNSKELKNFRLRHFVAKNPAGESLTAIPATLIDIFSGMGEWDTTDATKVPFFMADVPPDLYGQLQIFYMEYGPGWMVVPRSWKVLRAVEGVDGTEWFTFAAPTGSKNGWMITGYVPACLGCMYEDADGLIAGAHQALIGLTIAKAGSSAARVVPTPMTISHPNDCTAVFTYHEPHSPQINAVVYVGTPAAGGDPRERSLYLALPGGKSKISDFIVHNFEQSTRSCGGIALNY
jgi:hypothetical protein